MLNGAGDPERNVELRRNYFAGLANLQIVRRKAGIDSSSRSPDRTPELARELRSEREPLDAAEPAAARDDPGRGSW